MGVRGPFLLVLFAQGSALDQGTMQELLNQHNLYRCMHGLPLLTWSETAEATAQKWADMGKWEHSDRDSRNGCGENLAWGHTKGDEAVEAWYEEIKYTSPYGTAQSFTDSSPAGEVIGHYTAMIWKASTTIGCGLGIAAISGQEQNFWVCHYCPGGNVQGQFTENVLPPIRSPESCGGSAEDVPANFPTLPDESAQAEPPAEAEPHGGADTGAEPPAEAVVELPQEDPEEAEEESGAPPVNSESTEGGHIVSGELEVEGTSEEVCEKPSALEIIKSIIAKWLGNPSWLKTEDIVLDCVVVGRRLQAYEFSATEPEHTVTIHYHILVPSEESPLPIQQAMGEHFFLSPEADEPEPDDAEAMEFHHPNHHHMHHSHHHPHGSMPEDEDEALDMGVITGKYAKSQAGWVEIPTDWVAQWAMFGALSALVGASILIGFAFRRQNLQESVLLESQEE